MTGVIASIAIRAASTMMSKQSPGVAGASTGSGRFAVAAENRHLEIRLLRLGRHAGRRTRALHVDDDERQLGGQRQPERLSLQREPRAGRGGEAEPAGIGRADGGAGGGDLVLGLKRPDAGLQLGERSAAAPRPA